MSKSPLSIEASILIRTMRFELDTLDNALKLLEDFRKSEQTQCTDPFLQIESLIALAEAREASSNLRALLSERRSG